MPCYPTVKPVALVADAILDCSSRRGVLLDAFLGSGATLIAAERAGRCCRGLELDPLYVDTVVRRWQAYAGGGVRHAVRGQSFRRWPRHGAYGLDIVPYDVGYGEPPVQTRFRKGRSGNPEGRGKGSRNFATVFMAAVGQSRVLPKRPA